MRQSSSGAKHFAAGADIKDLLELTAEQFGVRNRVLQRAVEALAVAADLLQSVSLDSTDQSEVI